MPLILPVHLICNTSDKQIFNNIRRNSRLKKEWVKLEKEHDGIAILCGSGPSLADTLDEIKEKKKAGGKIFAMNGAALFLAENGIFPDYQVIIDARPQTADLIGPAREHLFASQVDPLCFERVPSARLWHLQVGGIEALFPEYNADYCLIGGAASVGNTATCLAYAMGYRNLQIYGYDSSHRDDMGHAFRQPMNDGDPCAIVEFNGKQYTASLTMKLQAEKFQETASALKAAGCHIEVHGSGLLPDIFNYQEDETKDLETREREKYTQMWCYEQYRRCAPGEFHVERAVNALGMAKGDSVIDFGCGTGRGAAKLKELGFDVTGVDFAHNCLDEGVDIKFTQACLWDMPDISAKWGFCTDVMEHIPTEKIEDVIRGISQRCDGAYFNISTQDDVCGSLIGKKLHMTIMGAAQWEAILRKYWKEIEVLDSASEATFAVRHQIKH